MVTIPGYEINELICENAAKAVYRGCKISDGQRVLIKVLKKENPAPEDIATFTREYEITKSLDIDGVAKVYGLDEFNGTTALILEDMGGASLKSFILSNKISLSIFLHIAIQLSKILGKLHKSNVIHKDVKPSNVLFNEETSRVVMIDFSISSRFSRKSPAVSNQETLEGTLAYISPEQTGRMNRDIDCRTDLYSLGITLYELLTGHTPFETTDPMEMVHCHLAKKPSAPVERNPMIPRAISDIILKLLSKTPEERYQSAYGLQTDLEKCMKQWKTTGQVEDFAPGQEDMPELFQIPGNLYGREKEIISLLNSFNKVMQGQREMVLVTGFSGVGKTSLIHEINRPIVERKGYFVSGKCDPLNQDFPYFSLIQAFRGLTHQLLGESEERVSTWKEKLLDAFGVNGQVIIDVIPEIEWIVGQQPAVQALPAAESSNRFNLVFKRFVYVFAREEHPLVLFLDDLQWADSATLHLITALMSDSETSYLFFIGTYRDHEVVLSHPLTLALDEIKKGGTMINAISLLPLDLANAARLVADTFHCNEETSQPLAKIVFDKTQGNPFFIKQLLKTLYEERMLEFDLDSRSWKWNIDKIQRLRMADSIIELMTAKIENLSVQTRHVLKLAACIGNEFDLTELAVVYGRPKDKTVAYLLEAVEQGLLLAKGNYHDYLQRHQHTTDPFGLNEPPVSFKFAHDRVHQAVYQLMSDEEKKEIHLKIGQFILENTERKEDRIFDIVNHFNLATDLIKNNEASEQMARLNLMAGRKAKAATAYEPALRYITVGLSFLSENNWQTQYDLTLDLHLEKAECEYLNIHYHKANELFDTILQQVKTDLERVKVYKIKMVLYTNLGMVQETVDIGIVALKLFDLELPVRPNKLQIALELLKTKANLGRRRIEDLALLPEMSDPYKLAAMEILMSLTPVAYLLNQNFFVLVVLKIVNMSIKYGNCYVSAFGYILYGLLIGSGFSKYEAGHEFGKLGLMLNDKLNHSEVKSKCNFNFGWFINHWRMHAKENITYLNKGIQDSLDTGDLVYAAYCSSSIVVAMNCKGDSLQDLYWESKKYYSFLMQIKNEYAAHSIIIIQRMILALTGLTDNCLSFSDASFDEDKFEKQLMASNVESITALYYVIKLQLAYLFENYTESLKEAIQSEQYLPSALGVLYSTDHSFYYSLTLAALFPTADLWDKKRYWTMLKKNQKKMKQWSENCAENFQHKYLLVTAEMARIKGNEGKAVRLYNRAIRAASDNGYIQIAAIGHELAAKYYLSKGLDFTAKAHLEEARNAYSKWGATAKVAALNEKYTHLLSGQVSTFEQRLVLPGKTTASKASSTLSGTTGDTTGGSFQELDLATIIKASQAISGEIVLERLLKKLMAIVLENAGAQKGFLILERNGTHFIEAAGTAEQDQKTLLQPLSVENSESLSPAIVHYVARTKEPVVLHDAAHEGMFMYNRYVVQNKPLSILCVPVIHQGKLTGILYLENNLATGVFTPERVEVLRLLSTQFAISIENARLYTRLGESRDQLAGALAQLELNLSFLKEEISRREQLEKGMARLDQLNLIGEMAAGFGHEIRNPMTVVRGFLQLLGGKKDCSHYKEFFDLMIEEMDRANSIITEFLSLARNKAIDLKAGRLNAAINALLPLIRADGIKSDKQVKVELQEIPVLLFDEKEIRQIILNLVRNGFEAMSPGGNLTIKTFQGFEEVVLAIQDQGQGIPPEVLEKIGTPFFTTKDNGTGLGLAVCYSIAARHNASIEVNTGPSGTTFFVKFQNSVSEGNLVS